MSGQANPQEQKSISGARIARGLFGSSLIGVLVPGIPMLGIGVWHELANSGFGTSWNGPADFVFMLLFLTIAWFVVLVFELFLGLPIWLMLHKFRMVSWRTATVAGFMVTAAFGLVNRFLTVRSLEEAFWTIPSGADEFVVMALEFLVFPAWGAMVGFSAWCFAYGKRSSR